MKKFACLIILAGSLFGLQAAWAQPVSVTWPLNSTTQQGWTSSASTLAVGAPQGIAGLTVVDYWNGNPPEAQKVNPGGQWTPTSLVPGQYLQFDATAAPGKQLTVTGISLNYGRAVNVNHIRSQVKASIDGWATSQFLVSNFDYMNTLDPYSTTLSTPVTVPVGSSFSLRIYPFSIQYTSTSFASHSNVVISGTVAAAPSAGGSFQLQKTTGPVLVPGTYQFNVMCNAPNGTVYAPVPNPVSIVLPGSGVITIPNVGAGHFCNVTEAQPTSGSWMQPTFTGTGVAVASSGWEAKVGPVNGTGGIVSVANKPAAPALTDLGVKKECEVTKNTVLCKIVVTNLGTTPSASPLTLVDTIGGLPAGSVLLNGTGNLGCAGPGTYTAPVTCTSNVSIQPGASQSFGISFSVPRGGNLRQCVNVRQGGTVAEANQGNNTACVPVRVP